jgi:N-methylhydantoinase B
VLRDVREGYVTPEGAARDYGVVLTQDGAGYAIDEAATARARAAG